MYALSERPLTFEEFLAWDDNSGRSFELRDGFPMPISDPSAKHEDVADDICQILLNHCTDLALPYVPKRQKQIMTGTNPATGREESRKADIVLFDRAEWERMRQSSSSAAAYVVPPLVIEVVSTNWREDYEYKLDDYEQLGIPEYWVADYAGLGGIRFIGKPKQPTLTVYALTDGEYQPTQFRGSDIVVSPTLPGLHITVERFFTSGR